MNNRKAIEINNYFTGGKTMPTTKTKTNTQTAAETENKQQNSIPPFKVTINRIMNPEKSHVKAIASMSIGGAFAVHGLKVIEGQNGDFVSMPSTKSPDGKYNDTFHPISAEARTQMIDAVLQAYEQKFAEQEQDQEQSGEQEDMDEETDLSENSGMSMQ